MYFHLSLSLFLYIYIYICSFILSMFNLEEEKKLIIAPII